MRRYPRHICEPCGSKHGERNIDRIARWVSGNLCGWCGRADVFTTKPRDFGNPPAPPFPVPRREYP